MSNCCDARDVHQTGEQDVRCCGAKGTPRGRQEGLCVKEAMDLIRAHGGRVKRHLWNNWVTINKYEELNWFAFWDDPSGSFMREIQHLEATDWVWEPEAPAKVESLNFLEAVQMLEDKGGYIGFSNTRWYGKSNVTLNHLDLQKTGISCLPEHFLRQDWWWTEEEPGDY